MSGTLHKIRSVGAMLHARSLGRSAGEQGTWDFHSRTFSAHTTENSGERLQLMTDGKQNECFTGRSGLTSSGSDGLGAGGD